MTTRAARWMTTGRHYRYIHIYIHTHFVCLKGLGFGVSGSGFRALGFGFWVSGSGFRLLGFGFRVWAGLVLFRVPGLVAALVGEVLCLKLGVFQTCGLLSTGHL